MAIKGNPSSVYIRMKNEYGAARGREGRTPLTTWGEVMRIGLQFLDATSNRSIERCRRGKAIAGGVLGVSKAALDEACGSVFVETASYKRARAALIASMPPAKSVAEYGPVRGPLAYTANLVSSTPYPWNEQFWTALGAYAIAANATGMVPFKLTIAADAVIEAIKESPDLVAGAGKGMVDAVRNSANTIANVTLGITEFLKWGSIATLVGIGAYLWWQKRGDNV